MTESLNSAYFIPDEERGISLPALQAETYKPVNTKQSVSMGFSPESVELIPEAVREMFGFRQVEAVYADGDAEVQLHIPTVDVRWVIVRRPSLFVYDKDSGEYSELVKGMKFAGTKKVTAAKLFLACVCDGTLVLDESDLPQLFTLKLTSSKTNLIGGPRSEPGDGTIESLNRGLCKHYNTRGWLTHLVSVAIKAVPEKFSQRNGDQSSLGIKFALDGNAKVLPEESQKILFDFVQTPQVVDLVKDPFGVLQKRSQEQPIAPASQGYQESEYEEYDAIPF